MSRGRSARSRVNRSTALDEELFGDDGGVTDIPLGDASPVGIPPANRVPADMDITSFCHPRGSWTRGDELLESALDAAHRSAKDEVRTMVEDSFSLGLMMDVGPDHAVGYRTYFAHQRVMLCMLGEKLLSVPEGWTTLLSSAREELEKVTIGLRRQSEHIPVYALMERRHCRNALREAKATQALLDALGTAPQANLTPSEKDTERIAGNRAETLKNHAATAGELFSVEHSRSVLERHFTSALASEGVDTLRRFAAYWATNCAREMSVAVQNVPDARLHAWMDWAVAMRDIHGRTAGGLSMQHVLQSDPDLEPFRRPRSVWVDGDESHRAQARHIASSGTVREPPNDEWQGRLRAHVRDALLVSTSPRPGAPADLVVPAGGSLRVCIRATAEERQQWEEILSAQGIPSERAVLRTEVEDRSGLSNMNGGPAPTRTRDSWESLSAYVEVDGTPVRVEMWNRASSQVVTAEEKEQAPPRLSVTGQAPWETRLRTATPDQLAGGPSVCAHTRTREFFDRPARAMRHDCLDCGRPRVRIVPFSILPSNHEYRNALGNDMDDEMYLRAHNAYRQLDNLAPATSMDEVRRYERARYGGLTDGGERFEERVDIAEELFGDTAS